jgi:Big-like domain-containing protein
MTRVSRLRTFRAVLGLLLFSALCACGPEVGAPSPGLRLEQFRPGAAEGVYLNEPLVLHFSDDLDPLSVTRESVRIRPKGGGPAARGVFDVEGRRLRFRPDPALEPDLMDGGLRPGTTYTVDLIGYPRVDGLRSRDGSPLERGYRWSFRTADGDGSLFADQTPLSSSLLQLDRARLGREEPIRLSCAEPLDPTSLHAEDFQLLFLSAERRSTSEPLTRIPLRARLVGNAEPGADDGGARIELRAETGDFEVGQYRLSISPDTELRDFGGNLSWPSRPGNAPHFDLIVVHRETEIHESFLDADRRSPLLVPGVDGVAFWANGDWGTGASASPALFGRVTIRLPAAVGDGSAGRVVLNGVERRTDLNATRLAVPSGSSCELSAGGMVVLRSQGRISISGELIRRGDDAPPMTFESGKPLSTPPPPRRSDWRPERLSDWLSWAQAQDRPWTVLIAGGDLVIEAGARLETGGPLLLVAGGRVVVLGVLDTQEDQLFLLGEYEGSLPGKSYLTAMLIDAPLINPLIEPLRCAVVSAPMPRWGGVERWISASSTAFEGSGRVRLRFLPESLDPLAETLDDWGPVAHPADLPGGALRLLIEIEQAPASQSERERSVWAPPFLDDVHLFWEPRASAPR